MEKHVALRIDNDLLRKLKHVSAYERRSVNSQVIQLILRFIADYEKEHEKIPVEDLEAYKK